MWIHSNAKFDHSNYLDRALIRFIKVTTILHEEAIQGVDNTFEIKIKSRSVKILFEIQNTKYSYVWVV